MPEFDPGAWADPNPNLGTGYGPPSGGISAGGNQLQLINDLGYNPSYPYGSGGSGVPTQTGAGVGGGVLGAILGGLLFPGLGSLIGGKLGAMGARTLTRFFQGQGMNKPPGSGGTVSTGNLENVTGTPPSGSPGGGSGGGFNLSNLFGNLFSGLPEGFTEGNRFGQGAPNFYGPAGPAAAGGPQWGGGSIFNANLPGGREMPQPGAFAGLGSFSQGEPLGGKWGDAVARSVLMQQLAGTWQGFDPAKTPNPGLVFSPGMLKQYPLSGPGNAPIINPAALSGYTSPAQSIHFNPRSQQ